MELLDEKLEDLEREKGSIHAALMDEVSRRPEVVEKYVPSYLHNKIVISLAAECNE